MRPSKYNYIVPFGEHTVFFNGISEAFFNVPNERASAYETIINHPNENLESFTAFIDKMKSQGFIVDDDVNDLDLVKQKFEAETKPWLYELMILPTYQCNLRCWYCVQNHDDIWISTDTIERIKKLIINNLENEEIKHFNLSWFGGEPLLCYDKIVELTTFARDYCKKKDKAFSCNITSNATLLNPLRIEALRQAGVTGYQITIDGNRETHNSIKVLANQSAYDKTLANVNIIAKHTHCTLRFNYTHENLKPKSIIEDLKRHLTTDSISNIKFLIYKVWQEDNDNIDINEVKKLFNQAREFGLNVSLSSTGFCYTDYAHFDCIWPNGNVGKCDNHSPHEQLGIIDEQGQIVWKIDKDLIRSRLFDGAQSECDTCKYLPICWGPCVAKREGNLKQYGKVRCQHIDKETAMTSSIQNICRTILQKSEICNQ